MILIELPIGFSFFWILELTACAICLIFLLIKVVALVVTIEHEKLLPKRGNVKYTTCIYRFYAKIILYLMKRNNLRILCVAPTIILWFWIAPVTELSTDLLVSHGFVVDRASVCLEALEWNRPSFRVHNINTFGKQFNFS